MDILINVVKYQGQATDGVTIDILRSQYLALIFLQMIWKGAWIFARCGKVWGIFCGFEVFRCRVIFSIFL